MGASRDDDVTRLESRVTELESECRGHVVKMAAISDERHSLTNQLRELSRRQRQVSSDWPSMSVLLNFNRLMNLAQIKRSHIQASHKRVQRGLDSSHGSGVFRNLMGEEGVDNDGHKHRRRRV